MICLQSMSLIKDKVFKIFTSKKELEHAGMGLSIIEALCDEMTIESSLELGTQLIMKKRIVHE